MPTITFDNLAPVTITIVLTDEEKTAVESKVAIVGGTLEALLAAEVSGCFTMILQQYRDGVANNFMRRWSVADPVTQQQTLAQLEALLPNL